MAQYKSGRSFEYRARNVFREAGFDCDRKAGSKPFDIVARKEGKTEFICECKKTGQPAKKHLYVPAEDIEKLYREAGKQRAIPLVLYGFSRTPVFVAKPSELEKSGKMLKLTSNDSNVELKTFLETYK